MASVESCSIDTCARELTEEGHRLAKADGVWRADVMFFV
jgi:hypothetical protein